MEISHLQHFLSMKVTEQAEQLQQNYDMVFHSKENVLQGERYLEQAVEYQSSCIGLAFFVFLFMVVSALSLLFLHWIT